MSSWTYVNGTITVDAIGRTQAEKEYILKTVLDHLPLVTGSEEDMYTYLIQANGYICTTNTDEFGQFSNLLTDDYGTHSQKRGHLKTQDRYFIVVDGSFRDRQFDTTFAEFNKWLCRLSKRVIVRDVLVKLSGFGKEYLFTNKNDVYGEMFEETTWSNPGGEPAWCEYLVWQDGTSGYPRLLEYKYYNNAENDKRVEAWLKRD